MVTCKDCPKCKEIAKNVFVCEVFDIPAHPNDGICEFGELRIENGRIFIPKFKGAMQKKEFKVGEVFQFGIVKLKCVKDADYYCRDCYFSKFTGPCKEFEDIVGNCLAEKGNDKTDVIFVKID